MFICIVLLETILQKLFWKFKSSVVLDDICNVEYSNKLSEN